MNYDIKIGGEIHHNGQLEFEQLGLLAKTTKEIAQKALMQKVFGFSDIPLSNSLKKATEIRLEKLSSSKNTGTELLVDCNFFADSIKQFQTEIFKPDLWQELQQLTPMALVIKSFRAALIDCEDKDILDASLLRSLIQFKKNFSANQVFYLSNRNSIPEIEINIKDFDKIKQLEKGIPEPNKVIVNGTFDELKYSKHKVVLITDNGNINAILKDDALFQKIFEYIGKELVVNGMAYYKANGKLSHIDISGFTEPGSNDKYFAKIPVAMTLQQQIDYQLKERKSTNPFAALVGKWPGEEDWKDIINDLD